MTVISVFGSVVQKRPLPSDSTMQTVPVSATAKFAPLIGDPRRAGTCSRRCSARRRGQLARLVGEVGQAELAAEEVADLDAVLVDRRHEDVRRLLAGELADQLGEVGLDDVDPGRRQRARSARSRRSSATSPSRPRARRSPATSSATIAVRLLGVARPVHVSPGALDRLLELEEVVVEVAEHSLLERAAGLAQLLPVRPLGDDRRALAADRVRGVARCCGAAAVARAPRARRGGEARRFTPSAARISARWAVRTPAPHPRERAADVHQARVVGRGADLGARCRGCSRTLSPRIAVDVSAFLTANVPPNPQHSVALGQLDEVEPSHRAQQP